MPSQPTTGRARTKGPDEAALETLSEAIESGAGLPAVARAAAAALGASVALIDRSSAVLAVAAGSVGRGEQAALRRATTSRTLELRVADAVVGELRYRRRGGEPPATLMRMVSTLLALELERSRAPEWASDEAAGEFVDAVLARRVTDRGDILARAGELGTEVEGGGGVIFARAAPRSAQTGDWRARVLVVALRSLRGASSGAIARLGELGERAEVAAIVPAERGGGAGARDAVAGARARRLAAGLSPDRRPQPLGRATRPTSTAPARRRCWRPTSPRPTGSSCSPSRTPAPTGCCCRR